ncbi:MAG: ester cyclase [Chitinophagaceae bacterium]
MKKLSIISVVLLLLFTACNNQQKEQKSEMVSTPTTQEQKIVENRELLFKAWNEKVTNSLSPFKADIYLRYGNGKVTSNDKAGYVALMRLFITAAPDINFAYDIDVKGNKTYSRWTATGTNTGMFGTQPASGKTF